jgi:CRISPR/Cas system-associated protein Cas7 (RAMP superfamily)
LQTRTDRLILSPEEQRKRQVALVRAIVDFLAAPRGAKEAAWAPHVFLNEGAVLLTSTRTAPFVSPIRVQLDDEQSPIQRDREYVEKMLALAGGEPSRRVSWAWSFRDVKDLLVIPDEASSVLAGVSA